MGHVQQIDLGSYDEVVLCEASCNPKPSVFVIVLLSVLVSVLVFVLLSVLVFMLLSVLISVLIFVCGMAG